MTELFKVGEEEEEDICFKTGETKEFTPEVNTSILVQLQITLSYHTDPSTLKKYYIKIIGQ